MKTEPIARNGQPDANEGHQLIKLVGARKTFIVQTFDSFFKKIVSCLYPRQRIKLLPNQLVDLRIFLFLS